MPHNHHIVLLHFILIDYSESIKHRLLELFLVIALDMIVYKLHQNNDNNNVMHIMIFQIMIRINFCFYHDENPLAYEENCLLITYFIINIYLHICGEKILKHKK